MITEHTGHITHTTDLSPTAKHVTITLDTPIACLPGSFINVCINVRGTETRRAFSVVTLSDDGLTLALAIRHTPTGVVTPLFWSDTIVGTRISVMGPMGQNTANKLTAPNLFCFGYGIGAGVIRAITASAITRDDITSLIITTGSRNENDIIYKSYFDQIARGHAHISTRYVLSNPVTPMYPHTGYVHQHINDYTFDNADVYMCGQVAACNALLEEIRKRNPVNAHFFVEAFH